jgi:hypothetical protein
LRLLLLENGFRGMQSRYKMLLSLLILLSLINAVNGYEYSELCWGTLEAKNKTPELPAPISDINLDSPSELISDSTISW